MLARDSKCNSVALAIFKTHYKTANAAFFTLCTYESIESRYLKQYERALILLSRYISNRKRIKEIYRSYSSTRISNRDVKDFIKYLILLLFTSLQLDGEETLNLIVWNKSSRSNQRGACDDAAKLVPRSSIVLVKFTVAS